MKLVIDAGIDLVPVLWEEAFQLLEITAASGLTIYDSAYLWLSRRLKASLVTADKELEKKGGQIADVVSLEELNVQTGISRDFERSQNSYGIHKRVEMKEAGRSRFHEVEG